MKPNMSRGGTSRKTALWRASWALALVLAVTACGGGGDGGGSVPEGGGSVAATVSQSPQLQYAQCMRDNGVTMPDPVEGEPGSLFQGVDRNAPVFVAADEICGHFLSAVVQEREGQEQQDPQQDAELLELATCLRDHGVNVKDPVPGKGFGGDLDRSDPNVAKVLQECQKK